MPFDLAGNYTRLHNWEQDRDADIKIQAVRMDDEFNDIASALNRVFFRNGLVAMTGDLSMGSNRIKELSSGSQSVPAISFTADPDTGMFYNTGIGFSYGGVSRLGINDQAATFDVEVVANKALRGKTPVNAGTSGALAINEDATRKIGIIQFVDSTGSIQRGYLAVGETGRMDWSGQLWTTGAMYSQGSPVLTTGNFEVTAYARKDGATFTGPVNFTGGATVNTNPVYHSGNLNPLLYALKSGQAFTGTISGKTPDGTGTTGGVVVTGSNTPDKAVLQFVNSAVDDEFGTLSSDINRRLMIAFSGGAFVNGNLVPTGPGRTSFSITYGTAAPAGGADGDMYFQYQP